jgi:hypothetical protein
MKFILALFLFSSHVFAASNGDITGTVTMPKELEKNLSPMGALFIIARKAGPVVAGTPPLAVVRIAQPKFPQKFSIGAQNSMMGGKFEGPLSITARYTPRGDALDKTGPQGFDPKHASVQPGHSDLNIQLK